MRNSCLYRLLMVDLMMDAHSISSSSVITRGGANLMMSPWVGLASKPWSRSLRHTSQALKAVREMRRYKII